MKSRVFKNWLVPNTPSVLNYFWFTLNSSFFCKTRIISTSNPVLHDGLMYGSEMRAQNLNVQYGKILGIFGANNQDSVAEPRVKLPFTHVSNRIGCNEPDNYKTESHEHQFEMESNINNRDCCQYRIAFCFDTDSSHKYCIRCRS